MSQPESPLQQSAGDDRRELRVSRRRLLTGGLAASPALFAIATRPARAATVCSAASAFGSVSPSGPGAVTNICSGKTPAYWSSPDHFDKWPHPYYATTVEGFAGHSATRFHGMGCTGNYFGDMTMLEVLNTSGAGEDGLGAHIVAGVLNAATGSTPVLDVPAVLNLWNECTLRGYYEAIAGIQWSPSDVVRYLQSTMSG